MSQAKNGTSSKNFPCAILYSVCAKSIYTHTPIIFTMLVYIQVMMIIRNTCPHRTTFFEDHITYIH